MPESFGARLRQRREEQQIALETVAGQTKIKLSLLDDLERDDVSHWPSGIFRRAFIRAYAHAIGLNPDVVVREFLEVYPDPPETLLAEPATPPGGDNGRPNSPPPMRLRTIVGSALGSLSRLGRGPASTPAVGLIDEDRTLDLPVAVHRDPVVPARPVPETVPAEHVSADPQDERVSADPPDGRELADQRASRVVPDQPPEPASAPPSAASVEVEEEGEWKAPVVRRAPLKEPEAGVPDLDAVARLCTGFACVKDAAQIHPLLEEAARILDARGLIVWIWSPLAAVLVPALVHGYSDRVVAQLPTLPRDADNATAAAFRSAQTRAIEGRGGDSGALVVPLLTPAGCAGVLALELRHGTTHTRSARAVATIIAALLAQLIGAASDEAVQPQGDATPRAVAAH